MGSLIRISPQMVINTLSQIPRSRSLSSLTAVKNFLRPCAAQNSHLRFKSKKSKKGGQFVGPPQSLSSLIHPVPLSPNAENETINVGAEITGKLEKGE